MKHFKKKTFNYFLRHKFTYMLLLFVGINFKLSRSNYWDSQIYFKFSKPKW